MPDPAELLQQSIAALRNAKRFSAASQSYRKDNPTEYAKVIAYLDGGARPMDVTTEMGKHALLEEDARRSLGVPPPPPPPASKTFTRKADFGYFFNGQGAFDIATPHGDGVRFVADTSMPAPWEFNSKICQGAELDSRVTHPQAGDRTLWTWHMRFPSTDNPSGFNTGWWGHNILMEFGTTGGSVGHEFTINTDGTCSFFVREAAGQFPTRKYTTTAPVPLDAWIPVTWDIRWSYGADGMMKGSIDGVQLVDRIGPTMWNAERVRHLGIGWYSVKQFRNCVEFAAMQYTLL